MVKQKVALEDRLLCKLTKHLFIGNFVVSDSCLCMRWVGIFKQHRICNILFVSAQYALALLNVYLINSKASICMLYH